MRGEELPDENHISRLCFRKYVVDGQIQPTAFLLRRDEDYLSVNWLESLNCSCRNEEIDEIKNIYKQKLTIKPRDKIALLNVGIVRTKVREESEDRRNLTILHEPQLGPGIIDPSHSGIYNLRHDDEEIAELILITVLESYSAL